MNLFYLLISLLLSLFPSQSIGIPCSDKDWYARNLWDMTYFDSRLFVGCGNTVNNPPSPNAGPINIWTYQDGAGWKSEFTVDEEEIYRFVNLNGVLTIPGTDPKEGWDFGNWYTRSADGTWTKHRNIPNAVHVHDITEYNGIMFAALGVRKFASGLSAAVSRDGGQTWSLQVAPFNANVELKSCAPDQYAPTPYIYSLFTVGDELYGNMLIAFTNCDKDGKTVFSFGGQIAVHWTGEHFEVADLDLFGGLDPEDRIERATLYNQKTVYILAQTVDTSAWLPWGILSIDASKKAQVLSPPLCSQPRDIDTLNGALYVLCNQQVGDNWLVTVATTCDLTHWMDVAAFVEPTFARSFALAPTAIYIGLGARAAAPESLQPLVGTVIERQITLPTTTCAP